MQNLNSTISSNSTTTNLTSSSSSSSSIHPADNHSDDENTVFELFHIATVCKNVIQDGERLIVRENRQKPLTPEQHAHLVQTCVMSMWNGPQHVPCLSKLNLYQRKSELELMNERGEENREVFHARSSRASMNKSNWQLNPEFIHSPSTREFIFQEIESCHKSSDEFNEKFKEYHELVNNDWMMNGTFAKTFPKVVENLSQVDNYDSKTLSSMTFHLRDKFLSKFKSSSSSLSSSKKQQLDDLSKHYYPQERQELEECIQRHVLSSTTSNNTSLSNTNTSTHSTDTFTSFHYPNFLEDCKLPINRFYFKTSTQYCKKHFMNCVEKSGETLNRLSILQSMDCASSHHSSEEIQCKNEFLQYFGELIQENVDLVRRGSGETTTTHVPGVGNVIE
ncbi:hypothetical protein FDP41_013705 [Naegleria fowleri]|uniref:Uncharacterized protein n=1 Tax=Naegleria fowleri TaxID=5763 RepID=A0A6A5C0P6_NAEFO|nr:uncharacterized protein FDP41_013705 [Naegleria fowleri]KAF0980491.1 hypothetical protein FDP41_013705 [Naegleria fowleri]